MRVLAVSNTSVTLLVGAVWDLSVLLLDDDGTVNTSSTVVATVTDPALDETTPTISVDTDGIHTATFTIAAGGRHTARVVASGDVVGVVSFTAWGQTASAFPELADLKVYLSDTAASDAEISSALAVEAAAQRDRCRIPAEYPAPLGEALRRRVARNLAARTIPVASVTSFDGGAVVKKLTLNDSEVLRLEAPYRKMVFG